MENTWDNNNKYQITNNNEVASSTTNLASSIKNQASNSEGSLSDTNVKPINTVETQLPAESKVEVDQANPEDLDEVWSRWKCLVCGYNYEGRLKIVKCPRCGNEDPDKFEDAD